MSTQIDLLDGLTPLEGTFFLNRHPLYEGRVDQMPDEVWEKLGDDEAGEICIANYGGSCEDHVVLVEMHSVLSSLSGYVDLNLAPAGTVHVLIAG